MVVCQMGQNMPDSSRKSWTHQDFVLYLTQVIWRSSRVCGLHFSHRSRCMARNSSMGRVLGLIQYLTSKLFAVLLVSFGGAFNSFSLESVCDRVVKERWFIFFSHSPQTKKKKCQRNLLHIKRDVLSSDVGWNKV